MNDAQQIVEFRNLNKRCDDLTIGNNVLTDAMSEVLLRVRAYENLINNSWVLTRWLAQWKIVREMKRIDGMEGLINKTQADRDKRAVDQEATEKVRAVREKAANDRVDRREKKHRRELKKAEAK